jgi:hypothetical protein
MMHVLVVEDETLIARRIERMVRDILGDRLRRIDCVPDMPHAQRIVPQSAGGRAIRLLNGMVVPIGRSYAKALADRFIE